MRGHHAAQLGIFAQSPHHGGSRAQRSFRHPAMAEQFMNLAT
jgi:hypothetical protein